MARPPQGRPPPPSEVEGTSVEPCHRRSARTSPALASGGRATTSVATRRRPGSLRSTEAEAENRSLADQHAVASRRSLALQRSRQGADGVGGRSTQGAGHQLTPLPGVTVDSRSARNRSTTRLWRASSSRLSPDDAPGQAGREGADLGTQRGDRLLALRLDLRLAVLDDAGGLGLGLLAHLGDDLRHPAHAPPHGCARPRAGRRRAASRARRAWRRPRPAWSRPRSARPRWPSCARRTSSRSSGRRTS